MIDMKKIFIFLNFCILFILFSSCNNKILDITVTEPEYMQCFPYSVNKLLGDQELLEAIGNNRLIEDYDSWNSLYSNVKFKSRNFDGNSQKEEEFLNSINRRFFRKYNIAICVFGSSSGGNGYRTDKYIVKDNNIDIFITQYQVGISADFVRIVILTFIPIKYIGENPNINYNL